MQQVGFYVRRAGLDFPRLLCHYITDHSLSFLNRYVFELGYQIVLGLKSNNGRKILTPRTWL
jgi:hypothetical protein